MLTVSFKDRAGLAVITPNLGFTIRKLSKSTRYGWKRATIEASGSDVELFNLLNFLRYEVRVYNQHVDLCWYGYIQAISIRTGGVEVGLELDQMYNAVKVAYESVASGASTTGTRATTDWATDADSISEYGRKESIQSLPDGNSDQAEAKRDEFLASHKSPQPVINTISKGSSKATLHCLGWYETLRWRHFAKADGDVVTTTQIGTVLTDASEFVTSAVVDTASGITTNQYRDGDSTALEVITELLESGTSTGARYISEIDHMRRLHVYTEPTASKSSDYYLDRYGNVLDVFNNPIDPTTLPVGFWCRLKDVIPTATTLPSTVALAPFFIDESELDAAGQRLYLRPRGSPRWQDLIGGLA